MDAQKLYSLMVDAAERAVTEIEKQNYGVAKDILIAAEQECEERYVSAPQTKTRKT